LALTVADQGTKSCVGPICLSQICQEKEMVGYFVFSHSSRIPPSFIFLVFSAFSPDHPFSFFLLPAPRSKYVHSLSNLCSAHVKLCRYSFHYCRSVSN